MTARLKELAKSPHPRKRSRSESPDAGRRAPPDHTFASRQDVQTLVADLPKGGSFTGRRFHYPKDVWQRFSNLQRTKIREATTQLARLN